MAIIVPVTLPWLVISPDTNINQLALADIVNYRQEPNLLGVTVALKVTLGDFLITVAEETDTDPFSGESIPTYTAGDTEIITILPKQAIFFKATVTSDAFRISI